MARLVVAAIGITVFLISWMNFRTEDYTKAFASGGIGLAIAAFLVFHARRTGGRWNGGANATAQQTQSAAAGHAEAHRP